MLQAVFGGACRHLVLFQPCCCASPHRDKSRSGSFCHSLSWCFTPSRRTEGLLYAALWWVVFSRAAWQLHPTTVQTPSTVGIHFKQTSPCVPRKVTRGTLSLFIYFRQYKNVSEFCFRKELDGLRPLVCSCMMGPKLQLVSTQHSVLIKSSGSGWKRDSERITQKDKAVKDPFSLFFWFSQTGMSELNSLSKQCVSGQPTGPQKSATLVFESTCCVKM